MGSQFVSLADLAQLTTTPTPSTASTDTSGAGLLATLFSGIASAGGAIGAGALAADAQKSIAKRQAQADAQIAAINSQTNIEIARIQAKAAADAAAAQAAMYAANPLSQYMLPLAIGAGVLTIGGIGLIFVLGRRR